jgi:hypothetical protein
MKRLQKYYIVGDYWIDLSISSHNAIFDFWICRDKHVCVGDKFPFWNFRLSILKMEISVHPNIF